VVFVIAMSAGMALYELAEHRSRGQAVATEDQ
jgi:hypothetical protein